MHEVPRRLGDLLPRAFEDRPSRHANQVEDGEDDDDQPDEVDNAVHDVSHANSDSQGLAAGHGLLSRPG